MKDSTTKTTSQPEWVGPWQAKRLLGARVDNRGGFISSGGVGEDGGFGWLGGVEALTLGIFKPKPTLLIARARANSCRGLSDREEGRKVEQVGENSTGWELAGLSRPGLSRRLNMKYLVSQPPNIAVSGRQVKC